MKTLAFLALAVLAPAADKPAPAGKTSNERVEIEAVVYTDKAAIREQVGAELDSIAIVRLRVAPRGEEPLKVGPDDFLLRSDKDGQRSQPFAPSQIAGDATLVVSSGGRGGSAVTGQDNGPIWGGAPGTGGRPRRLPGNGGAVGNTSSEETTRATIEAEGASKENPLLTTLKQKMLAAKESAEPLSGLLYFPLEGKHKPKDLELVYRGPAGKLSIRFK